MGSTAQTLRDIVERVVEEAKRLPGLGSCDGSGRIQEERNGVENSYEEVLATTILNKVTEKYIRFSEADPSGKERGGGGGALHEGCNRCQLSKTVVDCLPACLLSLSLLEKLGLRFTEFVEFARESSEWIKSMSERWIF